ncbi:MULTISPECIES: TMEM175 family protein [unclassified Streptomyces]|uniref:TMEM175 family protein n=1 Tax=unclassified Streptomyces TaxID=2593676 RepID=UPI001F3A549E|nr:MULTISPECIES: TMEM175 family protein [unclassified Streptomyces]
MNVSTDQELPSEDEDMEIRAVSAERLTFFGDAVVAIALTLLALELPVPEGSTNSELWHSASGHRESYLAFMISFVVIAAHWRSHHRVFRYVTASNGKLTAFTMYWLLTLVITPFATDVIGGHGAFQARFVFYATVQCASCLLFILMVNEVRRDDLYRTGTPPELFSRTIRGIGMVAAGFLVSIPVSFLTHWAYLCWIVVPVADTIAARRRSHRPSV